MTIVLIVAILLLAMLGVPLFLVLSSIALVGFFTLEGDALASIIEPVFGLVGQDIFLAIPLFTFAGFLMAAADTPRRFVNFARSLFGWLPGGIAIVSLVACAFFTAFTGASGVTIIAMGGLLFPILLKEHYPENFSLGLMTTGGSRGLIFPPSLPLILYATFAAMAFTPVTTEMSSAGPPSTFLSSGDEATAEAVEAEDPEDELDALLDEDSEVEVCEPRMAGHPAGVLAEMTHVAHKASGEGFQANCARDDMWRSFVVKYKERQVPTPEKLFIAGAIPGGLMMLAIAIYAIFIGWRRKVPRTPFRPRAVWTSFVEILAEIPIPILIIVGIYGGFFTAQEAAGVTAFYVLIVEVFVYRDISFKRLPKVMLDSMVLVGGVLIILVSALALKEFLVQARVPEALRDALTSKIESRLTFLLLLNVFLLVVGCLMDIFSAIMVVVPLIIPLAVYYGVHPVHLGVIFLTNLEIGYSTPPVGINLFIASLRFRRPVVQLYKACLPFLAILLVGLMFITYWEGLSLWLVRLSGLE